MTTSTNQSLRNELTGQTFTTLMADPPWRFRNRHNKVSPEHKRLYRYPTMSLNEICALPVSEFLSSRAHCYLWVPNALLPEGLVVLAAWGFEYKTNIIWEKVRKDGGPDGSGTGFYFRNVTEVLLFGTRGGKMRTLAPGRSQVNYLEVEEQLSGLVKSRKQEHSRKPCEQYDIIEACSPGPFLELFARQQRHGWTSWGN